MAWVTITGDVVSTSTKFGGTDHGNKIANMFNGVDVSDTVTINSAVSWTFENGSFYLKNPAGTFEYLIVPAAIVADRSLTLPLITGTDTLATLGLAQTFTAVQTFTAPVLGAAGATSLNKVTITAPATGSTLTIVEGATLTASATASVSGTNTGDEVAASATVSGVAELATIAEVNTGTDTVRTITPAGLAGSALQTKVDGIEALADVTDETNVAATASVIANTAKVTNATHTGDVTGGTTLSIASGVIINDDINASAAIAASKLSGVTTPTSTENLTNKTLVYDINAQTGTSYTFVLSDAGDIVTSNNAGTVVMTIPLNSSVAYPIGASLTVVSIGAGLTNFAATVGVTINSTGAVPAAPVLRIAHSSATAIKIATDTWQVVGDIS